MAKHEAKGKTQRRTVIAKKPSQTRPAGVPASRKAGLASPVSSVAPDSSVRVRMYRQGLGDCFLVSLPRQNGSPFYLMIDCGVILGTANPSDIMKNVVQNIIDETGGHVDLLVVTHEHWDHVSGFSQASDLFAPAGANNPKNCLTVGEVWLAWTEDPSDALATRLRKDRADRVQKLANFVSAMGSAPELAGASGLVDGVNEILSFFGVDAKSGTTGNSTGAALAFARGLSNRVRYCLPSDPPATLPAVPGVRIYTLGPPHDENALRKTDSTTEFYRELTNLGPASSFFAAATAARPANGSDPEQPMDDFDRYSPFDKDYQHDLQTVEMASNTDSGPTDLITTFFDQYYFGRYPDLLAADQSWRRIDSDWLGAAAEFALQLDSATNNTSLVLAIELTDSGKVLLFAADAQVGNWLSWQTLSWKISERETVTGPDLLKRTVFYKVGHHGSHNATLKAKGLELMRKDEFVAFIPVDHAMAIKKRWGNMPLPGLVDALKARSDGCVVRIDEDYTSKPGDAKTTAFVKNLKTDPLFYEWTMPIG
jgi:hypothetical protein